MEKSTAIIDAQTSLLRELRETYIILYESSGESDAATAAILRNIQKLALTILPVAPSVTQQMKPPAAEICKVTHDVVRIRNERNGQPGWENHAAAFCGISPKTATEVWGAALTRTFFQRVGRPPEVARVGAVRRLFRRIFGVRQ